MRAHRHHHRANRTRKHTLVSYFVSRICLRTSSVSSSSSLVFSFLRKFPLRSFLMNPTTGAVRLCGFASVQCVRRRMRGKSGHERGGRFQCAVGTNMCGPPLANSTARAHITTHAHTHTCTHSFPHTHPYTHTHTHNNSHRPRHTHTPSSASGMLLLQPPFSPIFTFASLYFALMAPNYHEQNVPRRQRADGKACHGNTSGTHIKEQRRIY